ncbi:hypothetical protein QBC42DRAFT_292351 [Cladorrhinum samala]|uniref:Uncharacterized protein n=1 Tax=Cladorrhinum samala TaxID=585594 RepID=A0AAV9H9V6_9PEZI|nr:hypothetical protein QBC42DRAFT_292351 [Cladorrhinum samala]
MQIQPIREIKTSDGSTSSSEALAKSIDDGGLQPRKKLIILLNKMDQVHWGQEAFEEEAENFQNISVLAGTSILSVSALTCDNVLEAPGIQWVKEKGVGALVPSLS